jgi:hypothetical protein
MQEKHVSVASGEEGRNLKGNLTQASPVDNRVEQEAAMRAIETELLLCSRVIRYLHYRLLFYTNFPFSFDDSS